MKNKIIASILAASMSLSSISFAQEEYNPDPDGEDYPRNPSALPLTLPEIPDPLKNEADVGEAVSPMRKGQVAPFTGLLFSPAATATIIAEIESKQDEIDLEVQRAISEISVRHNHQLDIIRIRNEADSKIDKLRIDDQKREIDRLNLRLKEEREDRPNVLVWTVVGVGAGVILSTLTAAVIVSVTQNN